MKSNSRPPEYNLMPHTLGIGPDLGTAVFPDNFIIRVSYLSRTDALQALLPAGVKVFGEPIITFMVRHSRNLDWVAGGELNAFGATIFSSVENEEGLHSGAYWPFLWENDAMAVILGREVFGVAKLYADISNPYLKNGLWRSELSERGRPLMEIDFRKKERAAGEALESIQAQAQHGRVIGWKHIPSPDMKSADLSQATLFQSPNQVSEAWLGEGNVVIHETDPDKDIWTHHVMTALRNVPRKKCVAAVLTLGSGVHQISRGRRLTS